MQISFRKKTAAASVTDVIPAPNTEKTVPTAVAIPANIQQKPTASTSREQPFASSLPSEPSCSNQGLSLPSIMAYTVSSVLRTPFGTHFIQPLMTTES
ncbi:unnamed protein product [Euphydryas editha]|uniref:Uncharacterized protein n=1 Tax=Euphydryas editha TaxID=104508 RepID=A0AAU9UJS7_EUPED|nr:unnamed protein product [Euphydryas editha]